MSEHQPSTGYTESESRILSTGAAVTLLALILGLVHIILHPLDRVAVDDGDVVLVGDVDDLVDVQHDAVE